MKSKFILPLILSVVIFLSCSSDEDKSDVNFIKARVNGTELKFNIISVDIEDYIEYKDIIISATMQSDPNQRIIIASQYGVTGEGEIWRCDYYNGGSYYQIQNVDAFVSSITKNSDSQYNATFNGNLINPDNDEVLVLTNGEMKIKY